MWLDEADGFAEIFKGYLPFYLLVALPIFIIVSPVAGSHEFAVYRMQQYDLHTVPHGCRSASFNLEGRSLSSWGTSRHCVVARMQDLTIEQFLEIRNKAGALLLVLPRIDSRIEANFTEEVEEHIRLLELAMSQQEAGVPIYFAQWDPSLETILQDLQYSMITDDKSGTALEAMFNTVSSNGYQFVVTAPAPQKLDSKPVTLYGKLAGTGSAQTIVIVAHYDSSAVAPDLSQGSDSNASGAVALLELARIFSRLYSDASVRGAPSLLFVLTSVGHSLNYFATKKWLEEQLDGGEATLLQDVSFVMCLDSISSSSSLTMHVSKPPKPGGAAHSINSRLGVQVNHKKINLADEVLAWQHERFSIRRMTAFTLSSLESHKDPRRSSILDRESASNLENLSTNVQRIARALASHIYNLTIEENGEDESLYDEALGVDTSFINLWYKYLSSQSRVPQIITTLPQKAGVTGSLERALSRYMEVKVSVHAVDKREPEYTLYSPTRATLYVYSVKPAIFDLILTLIIVAYLTLVYFVIQIFPRFYEEYASIVTGKAKVN